MSKPDSGEELLIPLAAESAVVRKAVVETSRVRITTHVEEHEELIEAALAHDDVVIERVQIGQVVDAAPQVRMEGDVLVFPIVEEVLVIETRLKLKEELRITRRSTTEIVDRKVTLRSEHADVERVPIDQP